MHQAQVGFEVREVGGGERVRGPEEGVVVGEGGEEDAEEEADGWWEGGLVLNGLGGEGGRRTADDEKGGEGAGAAVVFGAGGLGPVDPLGGHGCGGGRGFFGGVY